MQTCKFTHKILNNEECYFFKDMLTFNHQRKTYYENKVGTLDLKYGLKTNEQASFVFNAFKWYNDLPRELTLIIKGYTLKKWLNKYYMNKNVKFSKKIIKDNSSIKNTSDYNVNCNKLEECEMEYG